MYVQFVKYAYGTPSIRLVISIVNRYTDNKSNFKNEFFKCKMEEYSEFYRINKFNGQVYLNDFKETWPLLQKRIY